MSFDGDLLPEGHKLVDNLHGCDGCTGLLWSHRPLPYLRGCHIPGPTCPCCPIPVTRLEMSRPGWWQEPNPGSLFS